jgi:hypothetical protein
MSTEAEYILHSVGSYATSFSWIAHHTILLFVSEQKVILQEYPLSLSYRKVIDFKYNYCGLFFDAQIAVMHI